MKSWVGLGLGLVLGWVAAPLSAQTARVEQLAFLQGCWAGTSPQGEVEAHWTRPLGDSMLAVLRTVKDGLLREYELVIVRARDGRLAYDARPMAQPGGVFLSTVLEDGRAVFENLQHDFPQRVGYERQSGDALLAWNEGMHEGALRRFESHFHRVPCEG